MDSQGTKHLLKNQPEPYFALIF